MTAPLLETAGLSRAFGGLLAVDGVDLTLSQGEIRALIGPNGAGKTTLVSLLAGRLTPDAGVIRFEAADITALPAHHRVGRGIVYTFQITSIFPALSVFQNVLLPAQRRMQLDGERVLPAAMREAALQSLRAVRLEDGSDRKAGALSYGEQRLLEIAMGMALRPKLLILDEPTQGLGEAEIAAFLDLARRLAASATLLLIEHNMAVVAALADTITVLDAGRVLAEGTPEAVQADPAVRRAYLGT